MNYTLNNKKSFWWSSLSEFGEEVLVTNRKKLHLSQSSVAKMLNLNQSEVSRIERGITKPNDVITLEALCEIYKLTPVQKRKYLELTSGLSVINRTDILVDLLENQISFISTQNRSGHPMLAIDQSRNLRSWVESNIDLTDKSFENVISKVSHLLLEESAAYWDIVIPGKITEHTDPIISKMEQLANLSGKENLSKVYVTINKGFHAYVKGDYKDAKIHFDKILESSILEKELWKYEVLRANIVTLGKLKDYQSLSNAEKKVFNLINNTSVDDTAKGYLLEGLGRAYIEINTQKSETFFKKSFNQINEARKDPTFINIRYIQLMRSYLTLLKKLSIKQEIMKKTAIPALEEADKGGFIRHKMQILNLINS